MSANVYMFNDRYDWQLRSSNFCNELSIHSLKYLGILAEYNINEYTIALYCYRSIYHEEVKFRVYT